MCLYVKSPTAVNLRFDVRHVFSFSCQIRWLQWLMCLFQVSVCAGCTVHCWGVRTAKVDFSHSAGRPVPQHCFHFFFTSNIVVGFFFKVSHPRCVRESKVNNMQGYFRLNPLKTNDPYRGRTAPSASKRCILCVQQI